MKEDKGFTKVFSKYANFVVIFLLKLIAELLKYVGINNHTIRLIDDKYPLYGLIYNLELVKLEIFKLFISKIDSYNISLCQI